MEITRNADGSLLVAIPEGRHHDGDDTPNVADDGGRRWNLDHQAQGRRPSVNSGLISARWGNLPLHLSRA